MFVNFINYQCFLTEGQPESIVQEIELMVRSYVEKVTGFFLLNNL